MLIASYSFTILFVSTAPFFLQYQFHFTPYEYGLIALGFGAAYFLGASLNTLLLKHIEKSKLIMVSVITTIALAVIQLTGKWLNIEIYLLLLGLLIFATAPIFPNGMSTAFERHSDRMGAASSLFGISILTGVFIVNTCATTLLQANSLSLFSVSYAANALILLCGYLLFLSRA